LVWLLGFVSFTIFISTMCRFGLAIRVAPSADLVWLFS
jgi:hypothetical protein